MILILGGTAAYFLPLEELLGPLERIDQTTPYGAAFPIFRLQRYGGRVAFASRHGLGRLEITPPFVNARANIYAAHALGCTQIISWNGVGAINPLLEVHDRLALDGLLDFTKTRTRQFSPSGEPRAPQTPQIDHCFERELSAQLAQALAHTAETGGRDFGRGIYACAEGPRLETAAEIRGFRQAGADVVGMTLVPEIYLARELGIAFAALAYVTNYASGVEPAHGAPRFFGVEVGRRCLATVLDCVEQLL